MKALIVYDSVYGHTEKIAQAIGKGLTNKYEYSVVKGNNVGKNQLEELNLLIIGTPTHGGRWTEAIRDFLKEISGMKLEGVKVAVFDTRTESTGIIGGIERIFGRVAPRLAEEMKKHERNVIIEPEGFVVKGRKGPLKEGELQRAENWGNQIAEILRNRRNIS